MFGNLLETDWQLFGHLCYICWTCFEVLLLAHKLVKVSKMFDDFLSFCILNNFEHVMAIVIDPFW